MSFHDVDTRSDARIINAGTGGSGEVIHNSQSQWDTLDLGIESSTSGQKRKRESERRRMRWSPDKTAAVIEYFLDAYRNGSFKGSKKSYFKEVWEVVSKRLVQQWPSLAKCLNPRTVSTKHDMERRRYSAWKEWIELSGNTYNPETGACDVDRDSKRWQLFSDRHRMKRVGWIAAGLPLGSVAVYQELFAVQQTRGQWVRRPAVNLDEAGPAKEPPRGSLDPFNGVVSSVQTGGEDDDPSDSQRNDTSWRPTPQASPDPVERTPGTSVEQARRRAADPDVAAGPQEDWVSVARGRRRRKARQRGSGSSLGRISPSPRLSAEAWKKMEIAIIAAIESLVSAFKKENQENPVREAIRSFADKYRGRLENHYFMEMLQTLKSPDEATLWLALDEKGRDIYVQHLVGG